MTDSNTEQTQSTNTDSRFTTVRTVYARAAIVLLAFNFCLTGYIVMNMNETTQLQIDGLSDRQPMEEPTIKTVSMPTDAVTSSQEVESPQTPVQTREK